MVSGPSRTYPRVAAALVAAAIVIAAVAIYAASTGSSLIKTETTAVTSTAEPNGTLVLSKTWGQWAYRVSINSTSVRVGGALLVSGELTYSGQTDTTIFEVLPTNGLSVYNSTGGLVWEYTPGEVTEKVTITPGETLGFPICIPITTAALAPTAQNHNCEFAFRQQPVPGVYAIEVGPQFFSYPENQDLGSNLLVTANFTITTSPAVCPPNTTCASFSYTPGGPVWVESAQATQFVCHNCGAVEGQSYVTFSVTFVNGGSFPIFIPDGSAGASPSVPPDSILQQVASGQCAGTYVIAKVNPGQNYTLRGPDCFAGFEYHLAQPGSVPVTLSFNWSTNPSAHTNPADFTNSTTVSARFIFP
jgi:hypothetical protein